MSQKPPSKSDYFSHKDFKIMGIRFSSKSMNQLLNDIEALITNDKKGKSYIVTPNPEFVVASKKDPDFRKIINRAKISTPDGIGIVWAKHVLLGRTSLSRLWLGLKWSLKALKGELAQERVSGVDLMTAICYQAKRRGWRVFFLGAGEGVAAQAAQNLFGRPRGNLGKLTLGTNWAAFAGDGSLAGDKETVAVIKKAARELGGPIDVLFVAYGMRKQEKWIWRNLSKIPVRLAMGVGGSFDYLAGVVPRAPLWIRKIGFEWLYRLIHQPWRWRRQLNLCRFLWLVISGS